MVSHTPVKFGDDRNRGSGDVVNNFSLSRDLARPRNKRVMWLYGQEFIKVSYHPVRFDSHRDSGCGVMFLVYLVILAWWSHQDLLD